MANRRSFKTDESFLEKLAIGAIGTRAVFADLAKQGHKPIELERGSMNYKIWKNIKIKRLSVPNILCLNWVKEEKGTVLIIGYCKTTNYHNHRRRP